MCMGSPSIPDMPTPTAPTPPPPPTPVAKTIISKKFDKTKKKKRRGGGTSALRIPMGVGKTAGGSGLGIPTSASGARAY